MEQHWVPRSYIAAWNDPDIPFRHNPYINLISKDGTKCCRKSANRTFRETDMYTIHGVDGGRNLVLEKGLGKLEDAFVRLRDQYLEHQRDPPETGWFKLLVFVAAMMARSKKMRDHHRKVWGRIQSASDQMMEQVRAKPPSYRFQPQMRSGTQIPPELVHKLATDTMPTILQTLINEQVPTLNRMTAVVLTTDDDIGFITSDAPVVWMDPLQHLKPPLFRRPTLADPSLEITLPLSPRQCLILGKQGRGFGYRDIPVHLVREINRRTLFNSDVFCVVRRGYFDPYWKDPGQAPEA